VGFLLWHTDNSNYKHSNAQNINGGLECQNSETTGSTVTSENFNTEQSCTEEYNRHLADKSDRTISLFPPDSESDYGYLNGVCQRLEKERLTVRETALMIEESFRKVFALFISLVCLLFDWLVSW
jgi:hypothetical protein